MFLYLLKLFIHILFVEVPHHHFKSHIGGYRCYGGYGLSPLMRYHTLEVSPRPVPRSRLGQETIPGVYWTSGCWSFLFQWGRLIKALFHGLLWDNVYWGKLPYWGDFVTLKDQIQEVSHWIGAFLPGVQFRGPKVCRCVCAPKKAALRFVGPLGCRVTER